MYHRDVNWGLSPDWATVNETPSESYVGPLWGVKLSDEPWVKSISTARPSAESGGHDDVNRGLQLLYV